MKVVFLSFYSGINQRGVERWVYELATRISEKHKVIVFQNKELGLRTKYIVKIAGIKYEAGRRSQNWFTKHLFIDYDSISVLKFTIKILSGLLSERYDLIIPTDGGWEPAIIRIITWIRRRKMMIVGHAGIGWDDANNLWAFPDIFIALSTPALQWARKVNPFVRTEYVPDAVDLKRFNPDGKKVDLRLTRPIALCVSALESGKRIDLIIKAVARAGDISLLVCGRGELKDEINTLGKQLLGDRFRLDGIGFQEMPNIYRSCDILLSASLPSYSFEIVLLEALASGLPVIANRDMIRKEIIGDAGVLLNPEDTEKFAYVIKRVLRERWVERSKSQAKKFSWEKISLRYLELLNNI